MAGKKGKEEEKASLSTTPIPKSISEAESDTPSPPEKKRKLELQETTAADAMCIKEALNAKICGAPSEDATAPPPPLHPKCRVRKKSTL
uniref:Uncharacterized protein n=1 Tax=Setaria viridis TaxID=4556 RepID=A0A4U6U832_SETVI|nr:hypothetical protein SEVIR_6G112960v2 [Setaria viridis]